MRIHKPLAIALFLGLGFFLGPVTAATAQSTLIPANLNQRTDAAGNNWRFQNDGSLQLHMSNTRLTLQQLHIGGQRFTSQQRLMTPDGSELHFIGRAGSMPIRRRVLFDARQSAIRIVDTVQNPGRSEVRVSLRQHNQLGSNARMLRTDRGAVGSALPARSRALAVTPYQGPQDVLFLIGDGKGALPAFMNNNGFEVSFTYSLSVPAGGRASIVTTLAVRPTFGGTGEIEKAIKPFLRGRWLAGLQRKQIGSVLNIRAATAFGSELAIPPGISEELGLVPRSEDQLGIGDSTRLLGKATGVQAAVTTQFGRVEIPLAQIAAIVGGGCTRAPVGIYLRDHQRLVGALELSELNLALTVGSGIPLAAATLDRLVLAAEEETPEDGADPEPAAAAPPDGASAQLLLTTHEGDRLLVSASAKSRFTCYTAWGPLEIALADLVQAVARDLGHQLLLNDGSSIGGFLGGDAVELESPLFGRLTLPPEEIAEIVQLPRPEVETEELFSEADNPLAKLESGFIVQLFGEARLAGELADEEIVLWCGGHPIPVATAKLKSFRTEGEGEPPDPGEQLEVAIELADGSRLSGALGVASMTLSTPRGVLHVPAHQLLSLEAPRQAVAAELRTLIAGHIRKLGSAAWREREAASAALIEVGAAAINQLQQAVRQEEDLEIKRRVEHLLEELEE